MSKLLLDKILEIRYIPKFYKQAFSILFDVVFFIVSHLLSIRIIEGSFDSYFTIGNILSLTVMLLVIIIFFYSIGLYHSVNRYISFRSLFLVFVGGLLSTLACLSIDLYLNSFSPVLKSLIFLSLFCFFLIGTRISIRFLLDTIVQNNKENVIIYGAGSAGRKLAQALKITNSKNVVAFIDDDKSVFSSVVLGVKVFDTNDAKNLVRDRDVTQILLALPSLPGQAKNRVIEGLVDLPVQVLSVPNLTDILEGKLSIDDLSDISIDDLLGRNSVAPQDDLMRFNIESNVVLVTGAGGSIGSELCRQIIMHNPKSLLLLDISEYSLYKIEKELRQSIKALSLNLDIVPLLGSVQDYKRIDLILNRYEVNTVYHAAAYKHVPLVEYNVIEGVRNNFLGTYNLVKAAVSNSVDHFVLISSDKAVRPTNVMGATKRLAELCLQAFADGIKNNSTRTILSMVRFGNVLGSSGSVVPLFKEQINTGGPITITHPEITRYFMSIPEAAQLVIQAGALAKGGDVFVLDMGESVKIVDLAHKMVSLSGRSIHENSHIDNSISIVYTGLRPGEKLYEELLIGEQEKITAHPKIRSADEKFFKLEKLNQIASELSNACENEDHNLIRNILCKSDLGFSPSDGICDLVWNKGK